MTTQVGSAVAKYGTYTRLGVADHGMGFGSLDRSAAWDSLGRHSTISGINNLTANRQCQALSSFTNTELNLTLKLKVAIVNE